MEFQEIKERFSTEHATWIIAYCIDTDSFFFVRIRDIFSGSMIRNLNQKRKQFIILKIILMNLLS